MPSLKAPNSVQSSNYTCLPPNVVQHKEDHGQTHKMHTADSPQAITLLWPASALLCWTICSSGLILLNKELMVNDGFTYPMALMTAGQFASYLGGKWTSSCIFCNLFYDG